MAGHIKYVNPKQRKRARRKVSIRLKLSGTAERPRLSVFRSARYIYAQAIDDTTGRVVAAASELEETLKTAVAGKPKKARARAIGKAIGDKLVALQIKAVVFDRNGYIYHGRVKEIADGARDAGLAFEDDMLINPEEVGELVDRVVHINRVAKVVKGGRRFSFSALVVVGDQHGYVGAGLGKANEVPEAIRKGTDRAKRNLFKIPLIKGTIPHEVEGFFGAAQVLFRPAPPGTGVIAGGAVRPVLEVAGITDILTKSIGTSNKHNVIHATIVALKALRSVEQVARTRGKNAAEIRGNRDFHGARPGADMRG